MLLVDDDEPEPGDGREDRRARADDDARLPARDPLALVAPLGVRERRVQHRDAVAEARREPADGLRRERDLGHEHDRAAPALERGGAGLEVDLGLAAAGRAVEEDVAAAPVERGDDRLDGLSLRRRQLRGRGLAAEAPSRAGARRSPRRARMCGATSASARAGVEP